MHHEMIYSKFITITATEIQNIQLCCGDVPRKFPIPIFMKLPRLFACATTKEPTFTIGKINYYGNSFFVLCIFLVI